MTSGFKKNAVIVEEEGESSPQKKMTN